MKKMVTECGVWIISSTSYNKGSGTAYGKSCQ